MVTDLFLAKTQAQAQTSGLTLTLLLEYFLAFPKVLPGIDRGEMSNGAEEEIYLVFVHALCFVCEKSIRWPREEALELD